MTTQLLKVPLKHVIYIFIFLIKEHVNKVSQIVPVSFTHVWLQSSLSICIKTGLKYKCRAILIEY